MRGDPIRRLRHAALAVSVVALGVTGAGRTRAEPTVEVELVQPERLVAGTTASVNCLVSLLPEGASPLLVTPRAEGDAVEVVRGRLVRSDADDPRAVPLRFRIPIVARSAGVAVLRVRVDGFACERGRCRAVAGQASLTLRVEAP